VDPAAGRFSVRSCIGEVECAAEGEIGEEERGCEVETEFESEVGIEEEESKISSYLYPDEPQH